MRVRNLLPAVLLVAEFACATPLIGADNYDVASRPDSSPGSFDQYRDLEGEECSVKQLNVCAPFSTSKLVKF